MTHLKALLKDYFPNILNFWKNQIVCSITGISVGLATIALDHFAVALLGCVFSIAFLCFLQYDQMFQLGEKHHFKHVDLSRPKRSHGFILSLLASVPLFLLIFIGFLFQILSFENVATVFKFIYYVLHGSYIQLHAFLTSAEILTADSLGAQCLGWLFYLLYTLPVIFCSALGYYLGSADRPLRTLFGFKHPGQKAKKQ